MPPHTRLTAAQSFLRSAHGYSYTFPCRLFAVKPLHARYSYPRGRSPGWTAIRGFCLLKFSRASCRFAWSSKNFWKFEYRVTYRSRHFCSCRFCCRVTGEYTKISGFIGLDPEIRARRVIDHRQNLCGHLHGPQSPVGGNVAVTINLR